MEQGSIRQRFRRSSTTQTWRTMATTQTRNGRTAPKPYSMDRPSDAHCSGDNRPGASSTCTVNHWSAQRHPSGGDNRPGGAWLQHAELGRTPRSTATTQGPRDSDARPGGPCIRGATAYVHRVGPATLSDISLWRRQPARQRPPTPCATRIHAPAAPVPTAPDHLARAGPATL
jgi:hypothetical protein